MIEPEEQKSVSEPAVETIAPKIVETIVPEVVETIAPEVLLAEPVKGRAIELRSPTSIPPGATGLLMVKLRGTSDLVGLELEEGAEAVRLLASQLDIHFEDGMKRLDVQDVIKEKAPHLKGHLSLIVRNTTSQAKIVKGALFVVNEETPVEVIQPNPKATQARETFGRLQPSTGSTSNSVVRSKPAVTVPAQRSRHRTVTAAPSRSVVVRSSRPVRNQGAAVRHVTRTHLDMIHPREGEYAVLLMTGHVHGLIRFLSHHAPLHPSFQPSISSMLMEGYRREGAVSIGGNETVVLMRADQIMNLHAIVSQRFNHLNAEATKDLLDTLEAAIARDVRRSSESQHPQPTASRTIDVRPGAPLLEVSNT